MKPLHSFFYLTIIFSMSPVLCAAGDFIEIKNEFVPTNVLSVTEALKGRKLLRGRVDIKGKVTQYVRSKNGKNWAFLSDVESGGPSVVVKTWFHTSVGKDVVARGTPRADMKLFGGYRYELVIDDARVMETP